MEYGWLVCIVLIAVVAGAVLLCFSSKKSENYQIPVQPLPQPLRTPIIYSNDVYDIDVEDLPCDIPEREDYGGECHGLSMREQVGLGFGVGPGLYGSGRWTSEMKGN